MVVSRERNGEVTKMCSDVQEGQRTRIRFGRPKKRIAVCSISGERPPSGVTVSVWWDGRESSGQLSLSSCFWSRAISCWPLDAKSEVDTVVSRPSGNRTPENWGLASSSWTASTSGSCLFLTYFRKSAVAPWETKQEGKDFPCVLSPWKARKENVRVALRLLQCTRAT